MLGALCIENANHRVAVEHGFFQHPTIEPSGPCAANPEMSRPNLSAFPGATAPADADKSLCTAHIAPVHKHLSGGHGAMTPPAHDKSRCGVHTAPGYRFIRLSARTTPVGRRSGGDDVHQFRGPDHH